MAARLFVGVQVRSFTLGLGPAVTWRGLASKIAPYSSDPGKVKVLR